MSQFTGTGVALVTPFKKDLSIDTDALIRIVNFQIDNGIDYLVVLGTTAESATLSHDEKHLVIKTVLDTNQGRLPVVLGVGGNNTAQVTDELRTRGLSQFAAILSVSPFYNKPSQEGIYQHFKAVADASPIPVIVYNVPGRTASNMLPSTVVRLASDFPNIIGIKEAAGDMVQAMKLLRDVPKGFLVISGDDMITLPMVLAGGAGVISVIAEGFPREFSEMVRLGLQRETDKAFEIHNKMMEGIDLIFEEGNPGGIKEVFKILGLSDNVVRLPLVSASDTLSEKLVAFTRKISDSATR